MREKATADTRFAGIHEQLASALPTPVRRICVVSPDEATQRASGDVEFWLKDDGVTAQLYGGNKVRKLAPLLGHALSRRCRRVVTFGAAGSHHVLATTLHARALGLRTLALLAPQPHTDHAEAVLRAAIGAGLEAVPVRGPRALPRFLAALGREDYWIGPGGMGALGSSGYYDAALELARQVEASALPEPDWIVLATGSGSTAAGLLAGLSQTPLRSRLLGVLAAPNPAIRPIVLGQAIATARLRGVRLRWAEASARIDFETSYVGAGYGHPLALSVETRASMRRAEVELDPTYTEKALAAALALASRQPALKVLFWNTLSGSPLEPLLATAPRFDELAHELRLLLSERDS